MEEGEDNSRQIRASAPSGKLVTQLSASFNPPPEAEPGAAPPEDASAQQPTVLSKLQKWGDYASVGEAVRPTKFVPMKTPMSREIISNWTLGDGPRHSLTVPELLEGQAAKGRDIGCIIDLANHECLYQEDIPPSVEYAHVQLIAKVLPPPEQIETVARIADDFWARHPDKHIAIHCAYGFNRTGFVVCAYLIQCCGLSVEEAMESFAEARPPGVKHEKFINELYLRYGDCSGGSGSASSSVHGRARSGGSGGGAGAGAGTGGEGATELRSREKERRRGREEGAGSVGEEPLAAAVAIARSRSSSRQGTSAWPQHVAQQAEHPQQEQQESGGNAAQNEPGSRRLVRRLSSRSALSMAVESSGDLGQAAGAGAGAAVGAAQQPCEGSNLEGQTAATPLAAGQGRPEEGPSSDLRPAKNLSAEADRLESEMAVRRSTSLGLAKALCEDFSMFEGTPVRPSPLYLAMASESAFASFDAASISPVDSPASPPWDGAGRLQHAGAAWCAPAVAQPTAACDMAGSQGRQEPCGGLVGEGRQHRQPAAAAAEGGLTAGGSCCEGPHRQQQNLQGGQIPRPAGQGGAGPAGSGSGGGGGGGGVAGGHAAPQNHHASLPPLPYATPPTGAAASTAGAAPAGRPPISPTCSAGVSDAVAAGQFMGSRRHGSRFLRSMSVESDNQSLGFGARQALLHLRGEHERAEHEGDSDREQPLALLELFNADNSRGGDRPESWVSERSECEFDGKLSSCPSRSSSHQNMAGAVQPLAGGGGKEQGPSLQQSPQPARSLLSQDARPAPRNGKSKCRLM